MKKDKTLLVLVDEKFHEEIREQAYKRRMSMGEFARSAMKFYIAFGHLGGVADSKKIDK